MKRSIRNLFLASRRPITRVQRLSLVALEDRTTPAIFTVTNGADTGMGSLREAITAANGNAEPDTITFAAAVTTVTLTSEELSLTQADLVTINGGSGVTITRDGSAAEFRILNVAADAKADLLGLTLTNGKTMSGGGGIFNGGTVSLTNSTLSGNSAEGRGGGIYNTGSGVLTLTSTSLSGNTVNGSGGGIGNTSGTVTLTNSTLSGNTATFDGGGIFSFGTLALTNATVTDNRADFDDNTSGKGGGISTLAGVVTLFNTIVAGNFKGAGTTADDVSGTLAAASTNNITSGDAKLGPLADNGGPTFTHALLAGSPAIDAGDKTLAGVPTTDQRGLVRVAGANVDIGAFESNTPVLPAELVVDNAGDGSDGDITAGQLTLREAVQIANDRTGADTITFAPTVTTATLTLGELKLTDTASTTIDGGSGVTITRGGATEFRILNVAADAKADLLGLTLANGNTTAGGGGIFIASGATVTLTNSTVAGNSTSFSGGGIRNSGILTLTNSTLSGNSADLSGGGFFNNGTVTLTNSILSGNSTKSTGGGIYNDNNGTVTLTNSTLSGNNANSEGGGIRNRGILTLTNSTVATNKANLGGGINNSSSNSVTVTNSTLSGNSANLSGGGFFNTGTVTVTNSTLSANSANMDGGGVLNTSTVTVTNSTVTANRADADNNGSGNGGGIRAASGTTTLFNTIVAGNFKGTGTTANDVNGTLATASKNNFTTGDAKLGPLANNGGPTFTHALLAGSPALDAGDNAKIPSGITADQRGFGPRIMGGTVDIGAFEFDAAAPETPGFIVTTSSDALSAFDGLTSLREAVAHANATAGADTITFAPTVTTATLTLGELVLTDTASTTINGGGGVTITRDGSAAEFRILNVETNAKADLLGLTLTNGIASNGSEAGFGGGILIASGATVTLTNSTLSGNSAKTGQGIPYGGGIDNRGTVTLTNSTLFGNTAGFGGGIINRNSGTVTLTNSTLSGNSAGGAGGGIDNRGTVTLTNSTLSGNTTGSGGGIRNSGTVTLTNSTLTGNTTFFGGGGIDNNISGTVTLNNTIVAGNFKGDGTDANDVNGAVAIASANNLIGVDTTLTGITNGTQGNLIGTAAAPIDAKLGALASNGGPTFTHALLAGSPAIDAGDQNLAGVPLTDQRGLVRVSGSNVDIGAFELGLVLPAELVVDNTGDGIDGDFTAGQLTLREAVQIANDRSGADTITFAPTLTTATLTLGELLLTDTASTTIDGGTGVTITRDGTAAEFRILNVAANAKADLLGLTLSNGKTTGQGAGIFIANDGTVTLTNSTLSGNSANLSGGGIFNGGTMTLTNATLSGNTANGNGGGIFNSTFSLVTVTNSTLSGNTAAFGGGGICNLGTLTLTNSTLSGNTTTADGGGIFVYGSTVTLNNTIVSGNLQGTGANDVNGAVDIASANNLIGVDTNLTGITNGTQGNQIGTGASPIDAKLGALASNGGPTQTHALLAGSPALDAGDNAKIASGITADQRGFGPRVSGGTVDIGAYEFNAVAPEAPGLIVTTSSDALSAFDGLTSLREAVAFANAMAGSQTITFAPTVTTATLTLGELLLTDTASTTIDGGSGVTITRGGATQFRILNVETNAKADLLGLTLTNGKSTGNGGGILNFGTVTLTNSTLFGNTANGSGGGIFTGGTVTVTNSTLSGNTANNDGGGIFNFGTVTLTNATVTANRADFDDNTSGKGGGIRNVDMATLFNTIVAGNFIGTGTTADEVDGTLDAASKNNFTSGDAKLGPLANNGGPTFTHALLAGSPAIDAGEESLAGVPATDQRGLVRDAGSNVDIGAFEVQFIAFTPANPILMPSMVNVPYSQTISASAGTLPAGTTFTYTSTGNLPPGMTLGADGILQGTPTIDGDFTFTVTATASTGDTASRDYELSVVANELPTISTVDDQVSSGASVGPLGFTVDDAETPAANLVVTATSSDLTLVPLANIILGGSGSDRTVTVTPVGGQVGTATITLTVTDGNGDTAESEFEVTVEALLENEFSVGRDLGGVSTVTAYTADATARFTLTPFGENFTGGIRNASGDVNGDGVADLIVASGPGMKGTVKVFDGKTQAPIPLPESVAGGGTPFGDTFTRGVIVAAGDLNNDGLSDLIITAERGGGARVRIFTSTGSGFVQRSDFIALIGSDDKADVKFRGGSRATVSDINGDGTNDLIWAAGAGGGPRIATFDGTRLDNGNNAAFKLSGDFFALANTLRDGAYLGGGDIDGDGIGDVVFGGGSGAPPQVVGYSGDTIMQNKFVRFLDFNFGTDSGQGIRVAVKDLNNDNVADVIVGSAPGAGSRVAAFSGKNMIGSNPGTALFEFDAFAGFTGGVFVG